MITSFSPRQFLPLLIFTTVFAFFAPQSSADTFRGRVELRGVLKVSGPFNNVTARISGSGLTSSEGQKINYNASGLFQLDGAEWFGRYAGKLQTVVNDEGKVIRKTQRRPIRVTRRKIYFKDGVIRLKRPIRVQDEGKYRLVGRGVFRISA